MTFLERLTYLINKKGITKNKFLNDLKLGKNSFINWEQRGNIPSGDVLIKIANYFDVSIDYLLGNTDIKEKASDNTKHVISEDDIKFALFGGDKDITDEMYEEVKQFAQFVLNRKKNETHKDLRDSGEK